MAHILVVEDEMIIQFLIRTILESAEHSVYEAGDGEVALDILRTYRNPFDMILLDILMPKMDGFEFLSLWQDQPFRLPIIMLSTYTDKIPKSLESLISGHLVKPFKRQELTDMVTSLLHQNTITPQYAGKHTKNDTEYGAFLAGED